MLDQAKCFVGNVQRVDSAAARKGSYAAAWPKRYVRLTLGEHDQSDVTKNMTPDTAMALGKALIAEAKRCSA